MTITDAGFEGQHPRATTGQFTTKTNDAPSVPLIDGYRAYVTPYADEQIAGRTLAPTDLSEETMAMGDDQAGPVWTFAEEHRLADGRYLTSIQYVYPAYSGESEMNVVTETEQFVSAEPNAYAQTARLDREGATWHRYDSAPVVCSPERAATMARRAAEDAHLHQMYFASGTPWTGEPLAGTAEAFREASATLNGN